MKFSPALQHAASSYQTESLLTVPSPLQQYGSLATQMFVTIGIASWAGHKADLYFGFQFPVFLISLVFLAFGGIMYKLYQSITKEK